MNDKSERSATGDDNLDKFLAGQTRKEVDASSPELGKLFERTKSEPRRRAWAGYVSGTTIVIIIIVYVVLRAIGGFLRS
jgi:hypothetical protein